MTVGKNTHVDNFAPEQKNISGVEGNNNN